MKTKTYKQIVMGVLIIIVCTIGVHAQGGFTRQIEREFTINKQTRLEIDNIYGNVNIMNHDQNTISIEVTIRVDVRDKDRADEIFSIVDISISQEDDVVKAITRINGNLSRLFRGFNIGGGGLEINYSVYMPSTVPLQLSNKYGNVFIEEIASTSVIDIKYGKLNADKIIHDSKEPLTKVILAYSDAVIQEARWINAEIKYAKMNIAESKALVIMSKYSKVYVTKGTSIVCDSKYDTFELGDLSNFVISTSYSNIRIDEITDKLKVESKYTDVNIRRIPSGFESIKINSSYGNMRIGIEPDASYRLDGYGKYCDIKYPETSSQLNRIHENNELRINGTIGRDQNPKATVSISSTYGSVRLLP